MLIVPYVLNVTFAIGFPGNIRPNMYSVMTFSPGACELRRKVEVHYTINVIGKSS